MPAHGIAETFWRGRRVFVTGHTGFMGGWLCAWLARMGAEVHGYALPAPTRPNLFEAAAIDGMVDSTIADVRDLDCLCTAFRRSKAEVVFHLAAQPLVRHAYANPVETYAVNVMGTVHLLEAMRLAGTARAAVMVTTDKVYDNREWPWGYREADTLGGREPYGNSKACAELAIDAYRRSYFAGSDAPGIATVRAGNIIGGGDWAADRLVPDAMRAFSAGKALEIRNPQAVRPWQHALDPVRGFLLLAERLCHAPQSYSSGWNFGPPEEDTRPVGWIADRLVHHWGKDADWRAVPCEGPHEARLLMLNSAKAKTELGWACRWDADAAVRRAVEWYRLFYDAGDVRALTERQIADFDEPCFEKIGKDHDKRGKKTVQDSGVREPLAQF